MSQYKKILFYNGLILLLGGFLVSCPGLSSIEFEINQENKQKPSGPRTLYLRNGNDKHKYTLRYDADKKLVGFSTNAAFTMAQAGIISGDNDPFSRMFEVITAYNRKERADMIYEVTVSGERYFREIFNIGVYLGNENFPAYDEYGIYFYIRTFSSLNDPENTIIPEGKATIVFRPWDYSDISYYTGEYRSPEDQGGSGGVILEILFEDR